MALIGLDIGTTGSKCTVFNDSGSILSYAYMEYGVISLSSGRFELSPEEVWKAVKYVIGSAVKKYRGEKIEALCISSFGEAAVPVAKNGEVLNNSMLCMDARGGSQVDTLKNALGIEKIMSLTGLAAHPMYTIGKVMWLKDNMPDVYKKTWKFMLYEDFILYRLGGAPTIDYSLASRTMAFNITTKVWEQTILDAAGIDRDIFSCAVPSGTVIGTVSKAVADELGLPHDVKLVTGGHDQACAAIGGGIIEEGIAIDGIGTIECITPAFNTPILNREMIYNNYACVPHAKDGMYITYAFNFTGGSLLKWYRDNFAGLEKRAALESNSSIYAVLDSNASAEPTNILVLPHFAGAGTPYMDTTAKGAIVGLSFDTTSGQLYRALLEGVTYEMLYNLDCLSGIGVEVNELRAVGGGSKSDLWLQIKADILNKKVVTLNVDEAGTLGTAILAGTAIGKYNSLESAVKTLVKVKREFHPNEKVHEIYMENYQRYKKMYNNIKGIMA